MRIVLDTNIVLSALLWRGTPYRLFDAIRQQPDVQLYSSATLLAELADVLTRPSPTKQLATIGKTAREVTADYLAVVEIVAPATLSAPVSRDPDDDQVLACALAAQADLIVSGDGDLLTLKSFQGVPIVTAAQAVEKIKAATG